MKSRIKVVVCFYNEEFLVPFFLRHYQFADTIVVLAGDSTDRTTELLQADPRVKIVPLVMPDGMDDIAKMMKINEVITAKDPDHDWVIVVDSDELVWPSDGVPVDGGFSKERVIAFLNTVEKQNNVIMANMWQVCRHETDSDLDPTKEPVPQRRHGDVERTGGGREGYLKPIVLRTGFGLALGCGNHCLEPNVQIRPAPQTFDGAHWCMADPCFSVTRRIRDRRDRMSKVNYAGSLGSHNMKITEEGLLDHCKSRLNSPRLF